jgi:3'-phosphoadenosine 5'-phosphosulfate sulfotransferase (PAPS reductase)/FAD synthetase
MVKVRDRQAEMQREKHIFVSPDDAIKLTLDEAIDISNKIFEYALTKYPKIIYKTCLFSGGSDSTVLLHLFKNKIDAAVHINTGIGVEDTRKFVRETCSSIGVKLIEQHPPQGHTYVDYITKYGFPGPASHTRVYSSLKERALRNVRKSVIKNGKRENIAFIAGMRYFESERRKVNTFDLMKEYSVIWISPINHWTDSHMQEYRERHSVQTNPVSNNLHMSGECLCGCYAKPGEFEMLKFFYPETADYITSLEAMVQNSGLANDKWGVKTSKKKKKSLPLCVDCEINS